jgi:hypothetical protein
MLTIWAFVVGVLAEGWYSWRFLRGLRRSYPNLWERSGRRTIWTDGTIIDALPTIRFLWRRDYVEHSSIDERAFCDRYRVPVIASWAFAAATVPAFLISAYTLGWPSVAR